MPRVVSSRLRKLLSHYTGRAESVLVGRATTGLFLLLREMVRPGDLVAVPTVVCPHVPVSVVLAGAVPVFCDVSLSTYTIDPPSLEKAFSQYDISAVILVETFGHPIATGATEVVREAGIPVIYDCAQSLPNAALRRNGLPGPVVLSFGYSKLPDLGWGGAVCVDSPDLSRRIEKAEASLPEVSRVQLDDLDEAYRKEYKGSASSCDLPTSGSDFTRLARRLRNYYLYRGGPDEALVTQSLNTLRSACDHHLGLQDYYRTNLRGDRIAHPAVSGDRVLWRYSFMVDPIIRDVLVASLRGAKHHVSTWYPPCDTWFQNGIRIGECENARKFAQSVINLWVDNSVDTHYAQAVVQLITKTIDGNRTARDS